MLMRKFFFVTFSANHEFTWDSTRSLMDKLIKCVLPVCAGLTPYNRSRIVVQPATVHRDTLAVGFHFKLLKICWQPRKALFIGQDRAGRISKALIVPNTGQGQHHR